MAAPVLAAALFASGCAVPLGPGFMLRSRETALAPKPSAGPVHLRVTDRMENVGNRPLSYLDFSLPTAIGPGNGNLAVHVDGKSVAPVAAPNIDVPSSGVTFRLRFDPPWPLRQRREIALEYDVATNAAEGVAGVTPQGFYLADSRALPSWVTPIGVFAKAVVLQRDQRLEFTMPADFRFVASGRQQQRRKLPDGNALYRFRTGADEVPAFVIAGRYQQQIVQTPNGEVDFWTFRPLDSSAAQTAGARLAASLAAFSNLFGPTPRTGPLVIAEAPPGLLSSAEPSENAAAAFPRGLLLAPSVFEQGIAGEPAMRAAEAELVRIWFGWHVPVRSDAETLLGPGLRLYAVALAAEARGGQPARRQEVARLLTEYDGMGVAVEPESLLERSPKSSPTQLSASAHKAALFLAALDDLAGGDKFEQSLLRVHRSIPGRGLSVSIDDLRSALEAATGTPMADEFRSWWNRPGVPDDFRARYSGGS